ncbi:hypothetical protein G5B37_03325 [Rasiella rasia]|uniref:Uncharacterized protein n=1 Tax=Rasiella rasia TaxID=2744027 RepID=A0A6G6GJD1_9FLAO|nr:hypothetical protein [Rasiella rasia]QIE58624.1 hypothetical protein G5B37_03325 [Rasiella rasia]
MKLYVVKGFSIDSENKDSLTKKVESFVGYFTNLKEIYDRFDRKTIVSYSTISKRLRKQNHHIVQEATFMIADNSIMFNEIVIKKVLVNQIYFDYQYVSIENYVKQKLQLNELRKFDQLDNFEDFESFEDLEDFENFEF